MVNTPTASCVYILVGLSADRYVAACRPGSYRKVSSPRVASMRIACSLILPLLFYIPHCFLADVVCNSDGTGWTIASNGVEEHIAWTVWSWIVELCHRLLPSLFIVIFNIKVIVKVRKVNRQFTEKNHNKRSTCDEKQKCLIPSTNKINSYDEGKQKSIQNIECVDQSEDDQEPTLLSIKDSNLKKGKENRSVSKDSTTKDHSTRSLMKDSVRKARSSREQLERQLFNLLLTIIIVFLITTLPAALLALTDTINPEFKSFGYEVRILMI